MSYTINKYELQYPVEGSSSYTSYQGGNGFAGLVKDMILQTCHLASLVSDNDPPVNAYGTCATARKIVIRLDNVRDIEINSISHSPSYLFGSIALYIKNVQTSQNLHYSSIYNTTVSNFFVIKTDNCYILTTDLDFRYPLLALLKRDDNGYIIMANTYKRRNESDINMASIPNKNGYDFKTRDNKFILTPAVFVSTALDYERKLIGTTGFVAPNFASLTTNKFYKDSENHTYVYLQGELLYRLD